MGELWLSLAEKVGYCGFFPPFGIFCVFGPRRLSPEPPQRPERRP